MTEFDLIRRFFTKSTPGSILGVGDDAALLRIAPGMELVVSSDMLVSGTHFQSDADPFMLGYKSLAVNLSDMAAMGAKPRWATLSISLPDANESWLEKFSSGFFSLAKQYGVDLVGGDTTRGPLNICVTIMGELPHGTALLRSGAKVGDEIWVSGTLGDAALALAHLKQVISLSENEYDACAPRLHQPQPRVELGLTLRGIANSAIDVSDGLVSDLGHILEASLVGAEIDFALLPTTQVMDLYKVQELGKQCLLAGGDDYELCFTAPEARHAELMKAGSRIGLKLASIGKIVAGQGCIVRDANGKQMDVSEGGYDHFR